MASEADDRQSAARGERPFSPCINECVYDERTGRCSGCHRTMAEIVGWVNLSDDQRERVWRRIEMGRQTAAG